MAYSHEQLKQPSFLHLTSTLVSLRTKGTIHLIKRHVWRFIGSLIIGLIFLSYLGIFTFGAYLAGNSADRLNFGYAMGLAGVIMILFCIFTPILFENLFDLSLTPLLFSPILAPSKRLSMAFLLAGSTSPGALAWLLVSLIPLIVLWSHTSLLMVITSIIAGLVTFFVGILAFKLGVGICGSSMKSSRLQKSWIVLATLCVYLLIIIVLTFFLPSFIPSHLSSSTFVFFLHIFLLVVSQHRLYGLH